MRWDAERFAWWTAAALWMAVIGLSGALASSHSRDLSRERASAGEVVSRGEGLFRMLHPYAGRIDLRATPGITSSPDGPALRHWLVECSEEDGTALGSVMIDADDGQVVWLANNPVRGDRPFGGACAITPVALATWYAAHLGMGSATLGAAPRSEPLWWGGTSVVWRKQRGGLCVTVDHAAGTLIRVTRLRR